MLVRFRLPKTLVWVGNLLLIFLLIFTLYRLITFVAFRPEGGLLSDHFSSFVLGARYDLRWISFILLPIVLASLKPQFSPFYSKRTRKFWTFYLALSTLFFFFFFAADFGCFSYNRTRLNASALNFAEDPAISVTMLWQSYPLIWMIMGLLVSVLLLRHMFRLLHSQVVYRTDGKGILHQRRSFYATALILGFLAYGSVGPQPLKWKAAFRYNDNFRSYLALNPLQNFFTTLKFRKPEASSLEAKAYYPLVKDFMGWQNADGYTRQEPASQKASSNRPNIVLVFCESFSMYKSSMSGNALNTTPYFKSLCDSGMFFSRCFTPHFSTARGLFATLTGIPDVQLSKFSTRNPQALDQHTIINNFEGYERFYFLGGSASFNNFEGLVKNIEGVNMITEGKFKTRPVNVWGISDKDLFDAANLSFARQEQPFFGIIQTADNHRPFTIPEGDRGFSSEEVPLDTLNKYGFESVKEYNAFRYFDYCVKSFIEDAKKQPYFRNTIFVFVGDHGVSGNAAATYPETWTSERLTEEHVPLLFYAPGMIRPEARPEVVSQIDVLPSIAGLAGQPYLNTTLGRDVVTQRPQNHFAFIISHDEGRIGIITDQFFFTKNLNFQREELHALQAGVVFSRAQQDSIKRRYSALTTGVYETAKYMLLHNAKRRS